MIDKHRVFIQIEKMAQLARQSRATTIKESIQEFQDYVDELKREWLDIASKEYASERVYLEHVAGLNKAGWTRESVQREFERDGFKKDPVMWNDYYRFQQDFKSMTTLGKVFKVNRFHIWPD